MKTLRILTLILTLSAITVPAMLAQRAATGSWKERLGEGGRQRLQNVRMGAGGGGTIQYDPGAPTGFRTAGQGFDFLGNLFDTQSGRTLVSGSLSSVIFYPGNVGAKGPSSVYMRVLGASGSSFAMFLNANSYTLNTAVFSPVSIVPPFFVGFLASGSPALGTSPNLGFVSASTNGQGFHGAQATFSGSQTTAIPGQNMVVRAGGSFVTIPVELLEFELDQR